MTSPNPSTAWNPVPIWGHYFKGDDVTPEAGQVRFTLMERVTRVDGRRIYPAGAQVVRTIGDTDADPATRDAVRAAWRAADETAAVAAGQTFDGAAWDAWWNVSMTGAVFAHFPASDDPDIVQTGYQVKVEEMLTSGAGKTYFVEPVLAHLQQTPPGINLGLVEVPPGSPTAPAPIYAKGMPGGVASLDEAGRVPLQQLPDGLGGDGGVPAEHTHDYAAPGHSHPAPDLTGYATTADVTAASSADRARGNHTGSQSLDTTTDSATRLAMTATERSKLGGVATGATANASDAQLRDRSTHTGTQPAATVTGLAAVATSGSYADLTGTVPTAALPALAINDTFVVASQTAMLALTAQRGDMAIRSDTGRTYVLASEPASTLSHWSEVLAAGQVQSVAGKTGVVTLARGDVGLGNVDNTADSAKPVSTAQQTALNLKADKSAGPGYQFWNGTAWSARPTGYTWVEAYSDGTGPSVSDPAAPAPTEAQDDDGWNRATA